MKKPTAKANAPVRPVRSIASRFSEEQLIQIRRLVLSGQFEGRTKEEATDEVIYTLAAAALWTLGLDRLSLDSFAKVADVVLGRDAPADYFNAINSRWEEAEAWTMKHRARETQAEA